MDLRQALRAEWPLAPGEFLDGPLYRFFELATSSEFRGDQIRTVEHALHWTQQFLEEQRKAAQDPTAFEAAASAMAQSAFRDHPWLIEAFEGRLRHHG
jgi:hypothetical protein